MRASTPLLGVPGLTRSLSEGRRFMHLRLSAALAAAFGVLALVTSAPALAIGDILPSQQGKPDLDARAGTVAPTAAQQQIVSSLGAHATWNQFGTPRSLIKYGGFLATGLGSDP